MEGEGERAQGARPVISHIRIIDSLPFFLVRRVKRTRHVNDQTRGWRREMEKARARACTPLTKSEEKESLLVVYSKKVSLHKWHKNFKKQMDFLFLQERRTPTNNKSYNIMKKTWNGLRTPKRILTPGAVECGRKLWQTITYGLAAFIPFSVTLLEQQETDNSLSKTWFRSPKKLARTERAEKNLTKPCLLIQWLKMIS